MDAVKFAQEDAMIGLSRHEADDFISDPVDAYRMLNKFRHQLFPSQ